MKRIECRSRKRTAGQKSVKSAVPCFKASCSRADTKCLNFGQSAQQLCAARQPLRLHKPGRRSASPGAHCASHTQHGSSAPVSKWRERNPVHGRHLEGQSVETDTSSVRLVPHEKTFTGTDFMQNKHIINHHHHLYHYHQLLRIRSSRLFQVRNTFEIIHQFTLLEGLIQR